MAYDTRNVFARILRGELPCDKVYEDEFALAFRDLHPQAPTHVLIVPKAAYATMDDFSANAPPELVAGFVRAVGEVARVLGLDASGYRLIVNHGAHGQQEVPHLHVHLAGGRPLGRMFRQFRD